MAEAENAYRSILQADPNHFQAAYLLGVVLLQQRKFESAERQIGLAIRLQPNAAAPHYNRGVALTYLDTARGSACQLQRGHCAEARL